MNWRKVLLSSNFYSQSKTLETSSKHWWIPSSQSTKINEQSNEQITCQWIYLKKNRCTYIDNLIKYNQNLAETHAHTLTRSIAFRNTFSCIDMNICHNFQWNGANKNQVSSIILDMPSFVDYPWDVCHFLKRNGGVDGDREAEGILGSTRRKGGSRNSGQNAK